MKKLITITAALVLTACAAQQPVSVSSTNALTEEDKAPDWVFLPKSDNGLAASACVRWSGAMNVDKAQATATARAELAQQVRLKASVLDKLYSRKTSVHDADSIGGTFEQASQQVASETLTGSSVEEISFAVIDGSKYLCSLVVLENTRNAFEGLVEGSQRRLDPMSDEALYEEFRAQKTLDELRQLLD